MATLVSHSTPRKVLNFPTHLTHAVIRKHFPISCPDYPSGNLQRRFSMFTLVSSSDIGAEWELDYKGPWTGPDGKRAPTYRKELYSLTAIDSASKFIKTRLCINRVGVIQHLEEIRLFVAEKGRTLRILRTDNEFLTSAATHWAKRHNILFKASIPFEHDTVRVVERTHRTLQEMTVKALAFKPHLSSEYWGLAYEHSAILHNITSGHDGASPYSMWYDEPFDFVKTPILPFGFIVAAQKPLVSQTALSGRSKEAIFVGIAPQHTGGVILYNPTTKRTFIRHFFKYLSDDEPISTSYVVVDASTPIPATTVPSDSSSPSDDATQGSPIQRTIIHIFLSRFLALKLQ